jgi:hypothetical protein
MKTRATLIVLVSLSAGCSTSNTGAKWWAPATWGKHAPADNVDRAAKVETAAREAVIKRAQISSHETSLALSMAPASRPVAVATDSSAAATALLDQAAGPLDAATLTRLRSVITGLLSDNSALREAAEREKARGQASVDAVSAALARASTESEDARGKLRAAFDRENALANELRAQRALVWIAGGFTCVSSSAEFRRRWRPRNETLSASIPTSQKPSRRFTRNISTRNTEP